MAYRPSYRRSRPAESIELNLTPIMNLMVVMIPLLLSSTAFIKVGIIELNLPPSAGAAGLSGAKPKETARMLDLTVSITKGGFYIASAIPGLVEKGEGPAVPIQADGKYDFIALSQKLYEIKQKTGQGYPDSETIIIQAEKEVRYQTLVSTMDAARAANIDGKPVPLFPQVQLSAGII